MKGNLTKKIIKRIFIITLISNLILTSYISYAVINNYNDNVVKNMENINISTNIMFKSIKGSRDEILRVANDINLSYGVNVLIVDNKGNGIIGDKNIYLRNENNINKNDLVIEVNNKFDLSIESIVDIESIATMSSPVYINNMYYGQLVIESNHSDEFNSLISTIIFIIIAQVIVMVLLLKLVSIYIRKSIKPLELLKQNIIDYGKTNKIDCLDIRTNDEIEELSESFKNMVNEIELEKEKSNEFFNNATHELKTPITSIWGYVQALGSKPIEQIKPDFRERALYRMGIESKKMLGLIERLLDISRGSVVKKNYDEEVNVFTIIDNCKKSIEEIWDVNIIVDCSKDINLVANKDDISDIIMNLLDNAAKYSREKDIKICGYYGDEFKLTVENFIYNIPEDKKDRLLEPFIKYNPNIEENTDKKVSSSGLGLYLSLKLAEANNLELSYEIVDDRIEFIVSKVVS